jgi:tRNA uridine 5-carboxymethylaminomethyl modification enzyme
MAVVTDATLTHLRMLNTGKGPAVRALRAQVDVEEYPKAMQAYLRNAPNLTLHEALVEELVAEGDRIVGVRTATGEEISAGAVIVTTGTFLRGLCHMGEKPVGGRARDSVGEHGRDRRVWAVGVAVGARVSARPTEDGDHAADRAGFGRLFAH